MILRASDIACARGGRQIFANFTLILNAGESVLLQGPNGVGKSSLLRLVSGLIYRNKGIIENRERVALADEHLALDAGKRLGDALGFWARIDGVEQAPLDAAMAHFALKPLADIPVRMLSTGQRKRAILARVMASGAALWLLDEPGNGLDGASLAALGKAMDAHLAGGGAIIAASHFNLPHDFTRRIDMTELAA